MEVPPASRGLVPIFDSSGLRLDDRLIGSKRAGTASRDGGRPEYGTYLAPGKGSLSRLLGRYPRVDVESEATPSTFPSSGS